jgi:hypothetical protein
MTNAAHVAATDGEVIDHETPVTRKSHENKTKCYFIQTFDELISSGKSRCTACTYAGLAPLY